MKHSRRSAFTLIELSMVLAIVGLITGGVLLGKNMVRGAQIQSTIADVQNYFAAIRQYQTMYEYLPGDDPLAVRRWGRADNGSDLTVNCAAPITDHANIRATCNGDGDGFVTMANSENYRIWQHLSLAGLIQGSYTGVSNGTGNTNYTQPGVNSPKFAIKNLGIFIFPWGIQDATSTSFYPGDYNNVLQIGGYTGDWPSAGIFSGTEVYNIDKKVDDGMPGLGNVREFLNECATTSNANTAYYAKTAYKNSCKLIFLSEFQKPIVKQ